MDFLLGGCKDAVERVSTFFAGETRIPYDGKVTLYSTGTINRVPTAAISRSVF